MLERRRRGIVVRFYEIPMQAIGRLVCEQRVSQRGLRQAFALADEGLEALKDELIFAKQLAVDAAGFLNGATGSVAAGA